MLDVEGQTFSGNTHGDGWIKVPIPPGAQEGTLYLGKKRRVYKLKLGHVDPYDEVSGAKARLRNLGYYTGSIDGELNEETTEAVKWF